jgi:hypothetical protein
MRFAKETEKMLFERIFPSAGWGTTGQAWQNAQKVPPRLAHHNLKCGAVDTIFNLTVKWNFFKIVAFLGMIRKLFTR